MKKIRHRAAVRRGGLSLASILLLVLLAAPALHAGTSTLQNPVVTFSSPGQKDVALTACNSLGCTTVHRTVTVLDPKPVVSTVGVNPLLAEVGQLVHLTGAALGQPPLTYSWLISNGITTVTQLPGANPYWDTTGFALGTYLATLQVQNAAGTALSLPVTIVLVAAKPSAFYTLEPCRLIDTRSGNFPLVSGAAPLSIDIRLGFCGVPATARAIAANVTAVTPAGQGTITLFPGNYPQPQASTVSFNANVNRSVGTILDVATDGTSKINAVSTIPTGGSVHLIVDVFGYFDTPPPVGP